MSSVEINTVFLTEKQNKACGFKIKMLWCFPLAPVTHVCEEVAGIYYILYFDCTVKLFMFSFTMMAKVSAEGLHKFSLRNRSSRSWWENWCRELAPTCSISSLSKILVESSSLSSGSSTAYSYWVFITMCWYNHNRTACRFNIQLLQDFLVLKFLFVSVTFITQNRQWHTLYSPWCLTCLLYIKLLFLVCPLYYI